MHDPIAQLLGWIATALFTVCYIPQMLKTYRTRRIDGLSFRLLFISFVANIIAFIYASLIDQRPLQIKYTLALLFLSGCIWLYLNVYFQNRRQRGEAGSDTGGSSSAPPADVPL